MAKRGHYGRWTESDLLLAIAAYKKGDKGLNECSRFYDIPKATIKRHADGKNLIVNEVKALGRPPTFPSNMEKILSEHILQLEESFFSLTVREIRKLAFDVAERYNLPHTFNKEKKIAGKKWFYAFMRRNKQLSLPKPEGASMARAKGFNRENVDNFFDTLENIVDKFKFTAGTIFNVDELGFLSAQKAPQKGVTCKTKQQVGIITRGEYDVNTTMVCAVSAAGVYIPPMIIFKGEKINNDLKIGAPPATIITISDTGYINSDLFIKWLRHFKNHVNCNKDKKVLLLLDGHTTHSKNLDACNFARDNGIVLLQLPGHAAHRLQPLGVAFFGPLEIYFTQAQETFLHQYKGDKISQTQIYKLLNEAYGKAATVAIAENGFRASGIWPLNRHVFQDHKFSAANILQRSNTPSEITLNCINIPIFSYSSDSESSNDNSAVSRKKSCQGILQPISRSPIRNSQPDSSNSRTTEIAQKAVIIASTSYKKTR